MQSASRDRIVQGRRPGSLVIYAGPDLLAISTSARPTCPGGVAQQDPFPVG
jgi:hypothetical protein